MDNQNNKEKITLSIIKKMVDDSLQPYSTPMPSEVLRAIKKVLDWYESSAVNEQPE